MYLTPKLFIPVVHEVVVVMRYVFCFVDSFITQTPQPTYNYILGLSHLTCVPQPKYVCADI